MSVIRSRSLIHITENATKALKMALQNNGAKYVRLAIDGKGCSGLTYTMKTTEHKDKSDELIKIGEEAGLLIGPKTAYIIAGTTLDHETYEMGSRFIYKNPNVKNTCGCGASFT